MRKYRTRETFGQLRLFPRDDLESKLLEARHLIPREEYQILKKKEPTYQDVVYTIELYKNRILKRY